MALLALTSFAGSPGVTTTAVAAATLSESPVLLVEADMKGGSDILAGRFASRHPHDRSVVWLADHVDDTAHFADHVWDQTIALPGSDHAWLVPGVSAPVQARSLAGRWDGIGAGLAALSAATGHDVIVDLGRWSTVAAAHDLIAHVDALLVLTDARLSSLNATRQGLARLGEEHGGAALTRTAVSVVQRQWSWRAQDRSGWRTQPYRTREVSSLLAPTAMISPIPFRQVDAAVYSDCGELTRWHDHSAYVRAIRGVLADVHEHARKAASVLGPRSHA